MYMQFNGVMKAPHACVHVIVSTHSEQSDCIHVFLCSPFVCLIQRISYSIGSRGLGCILTCEPT